MSDRTIRLDYGDRTDEQLVQALGNVWFQGLILAVLAMVVPVLAGFDLSLWQWPILVGIPLVAWWFGNWYGRFIGDRGGSGLR